MITTEIKINGLDELIERMDRIETLVKGKYLNSPPVKEWYDIREAAAYLNTSVSTVRRLLDRKLLERALDTWTIRIPRESLEAYKKKVLPVS